MLRRKNKIDIVEYTEDFYSVRNVVLGTKLHLYYHSAFFGHFPVSIFIGTYTVNEL